MKKPFFASVALLLWAPLCLAETGVSASYGLYKHAQKAGRVAVQSRLPVTFFEYCPWQIKPYLEISYLHLHASDVRRGQVDSIDALAAAPVFRLIKDAPVWQTHPFIEAGIGPAWVSERSFAGRRLGIPHQFEDRLGAGLRFAALPIECLFRFTHYSNAHMAYNNSGFNVYTFTIGYWTAE